MIKVIMFLECLLISVILYGFGFVIGYMSGNKSKKSERILSGMTAQKAAEELRRFATQINLIPHTTTGEAMKLAIEVLEDYAKQEIKENELYRGDNEY